MQYSLFAVCYAWWFLTLLSCYCSYNSVWWFAHSLTLRSHPGATAGGSTFSFSCWVRITRDSPHDQRQLNVKGNITLNLLLSACPSPLNKSTKYLHMVQTVVACPGVLLRFFPGPSSGLLSVLCLVWPLSHGEKLSRWGQLLRIGHVPR